LGERFVAGLVAAGVTEAVVAPGSRNAPISLALYQADKRGELRLHVRIDERSAAFLAVGLARGSGKCVPVVVTSGTAAAECLAACWEARTASVPLLVVTADRPPDLIGTGANQTIQQSQMFGHAVSLYLECPLPTQPSDAETWFSRSRDAAEFATLNMTSVQLEAPL
jgi:2-succinyl-5-enolpyruvyl-6-hydroxy-3-cyclohexene-1-carboxylate synthase